MIIFSNTGSHHLVDGLFRHGLPQISIVEIIKKKNNIDFDKLHQEHMRDAAQSPKIHERFEQAKHSCRHGVYIKEWNTN